MYFYQQKMYRLFYFLLVCLSATIMQAQVPKKMRLPDNLVEVSGLYYAGADSLWWHNDSGDTPRLVLTDDKGRLRQEILLPVRNRDWEDITADAAGNIYIGDFGNNRNARRDLCIYIYQPESGAIDSIVFTYPDQTAFPPPPAEANFDMEGFFWRADSLHLFSKNRLIAGNYFTKHYVLPAQAGAYVAQLRDSLYLPKRVVTAAALSPDGETVTLLSYYYRLLLGFIPKTRTTIWLLSDFEGSNFLRGKIRKQKVPKFLVPTQFESIDFIDGETVLVASERTPLYKQQAKRVRLKLQKPVVRP